MKKLFASLFLLAVLFAAPFAVDAQTEFYPTAPTRLIINTTATDFTLVAAPAAGLRIRVTSVIAQNVGTTAAARLWLCDGTCRSAANIKFDTLLSVSSAIAGGVVFTIPSCASTSCHFVLSPATALIAQADTGETNAVRLSLVYYVE